MRGRLPNGTLAALRLYAARPSLRGNFWLLIAALMLAGAALGVPSTLRHVHAKGPIALYGRQTLMVWWMAAFYGAAGLASIYWGRLGSNIAAMQPSLLAAEQMAATLAIVLFELVFAAPLVALGGSIPSALALACLASVGGFGFGRSSTRTMTGQGRPQQAVTNFLFLPLLFVGNVDPVVRTVGLAPAWITLPLSVLVLGLVIASLRYRPAWAARQEVEAAEIVTRLAGQPAGARVERLQRLLAWRPGVLREQPLPPGPFNPGTLGLALQVLAVLAIGATLGWVMQALSGSGHRPFPGALLGSAASMVVLPSSAWLLARGEWTRIFVAGRYGARRRFAVALVRAHLWRTAHAGLVCACVLWLLMVVLHLAPPAVGLRRAAAVGLMLFAGGQLGCLGAMASGLSKLWIGTGNFGAMLAINVVAGTLIAHDWPFFAYLIAVAVTAAAGAAVWLLGPRGLIRADWTPDDSNG